MDDLPTVPITNLIDSPRETIKVNFNFIHKLYFIDITANDYAELTNFAMDLFIEGRLLFHEDFVEAAKPRQKSLQASLDFLRCRSLTS